MSQENKERIGGGIEGGGKSLKRGHPTLLGGRRRALEPPGEAGSGIEESFKRVRIAVSAGELRLKKDLEELCQDLIANGFFAYTQSRQNPLSLQLRFASAGDLSYSVQIPRFYPHYPPEIVLNEHEHYVHRQHLDEQGRLSLPMLGPHWMSILTFRDVLVVVEQFGKELKYNTRNHDMDI